MGEIADAGQQHLRALKEANRVRLGQAEIKQQVAQGVVDAADVVMSCPWPAHSMSISALLTSQRRWGAVRCRRILVSIGVTENKTVGSLTERQRMALVDALRAKAGSSERPSERSEDPERSSERRGTLTPV